MTKIASIYLLSCRHKIPIEGMKGQVQQQHYRGEWQQDGALLLSFMGTPLMEDSAR